MGFLPISLLSFSLFLSCSCSVGCGKIHKETPCVKPAADAESAKYEGAGARMGEGQVGNKTTNSNRGFMQAEEDENRLTEAQRDELLSNTAVGAAVRDPKLQAVVRRIDSARDPAAALQREMQDPDFEAFANVLLDAIGATNEPGQEREAKVDRARAELQRLLSGEEGD